MAKKTKSVSNPEPVLPEAVPAAVPAAYEGILPAALGLEAMVNEKTRHSTVNAFSGHEYVRYEWRAVPVGFEAQAQAHPYLSVRARSGAAPQPAAVLEDENPDALEILPVGGAPQEPVTEETLPPADDQPTGE
jgi:hypothetical protein